MTAVDAVEITDRDDAAEQGVGNLIERKGSQRRRKDAGGHGRHRSGFGDRNGPGAG
jgi:hypothetical protein